MPKTAKQLKQEIERALSGEPTTPDHARFKVHGARAGENRVDQMDSPIAADRLARRWAKEDFLITVFEKDRSTGETRAVMVSNRKNGKMQIKILDPGFARAIGI